MCERSFGPKAHSFFYFDILYHFVLFFMGQKQMNKYLYLFLMIPMSRNNLCFLQQKDTEFPCILHRTKKEET
jgi:hypothetical protein